MRKSCCIDDPNITPRQPLRSMCLRSDCYSGHSHKSPSINYGKTLQLNSSKKICTGHNHHPNKEKVYDSYSSANLSEITSIKQFVVQSVEKYSTLKEHFCSDFKNLGSQNSVSINGNLPLSRYKEKLSDFILSDTLVNNNSINQEELALINNNCCTTTNLEMSRSKDYSRRSYTVNALSESETEDGILETTRKKRSSNRSRSSKKSEVSAMNNHSNHTSISHSAIHENDHSEISQRLHSSRYSSTYKTPPNFINHNSELYQTSGNKASFMSPSLSPEIDISTVQYTPIDKFRWVLWKSIYLKIIKCVNFDVWLLSRLHNYRWLLVLLLLIPFLAYLLYGGFQYESKNKHSSDISSNVITLSSKAFSLFWYKENATISSSSEETSYFNDFFKKISATFWSILYFLSNLFSSNNENVKSIVEQVIEEKLEIFKKLTLNSQLLYTRNAVKENTDENRKEKENLKLELQKLKEFVHQIKDDVSQKSEQSSKYSRIIDDYNVQLETINEKLRKIEVSYLALDKTIQEYKDEKLTLADFNASFEKHFLIVLKQLVDGNEDKNSAYHFFYEWLNSKLASEKENLSRVLKLELEKLKDSEVKFDDQNKKILENMFQEYLQRNIATYSKVNISTGDESLNVFKKLIRESLLLYDADKTGLVDYALESGGGSVLSTRCSENYAEKDGTISVLGFSLWSSHNSPRTAIQPDMQPGKCWAFKGSQGFLVIQLSYTIHPTGFTLEHIPVSLSPSGTIDSAPKDFSVWGLLSEKDNEGILLGEYSYDQNGDPLQYFPSQKTHVEPFSYIELKIHSNHGNLDYTCLYRFRVHGKRPKY